MCKKNIAEVKLDNLDEPFKILSVKGTISGKFFRHINHAIHNLSDCQKIIEKNQP